MKNAAALGKGRGAEVRNELVGSDSNNISARSSQAQPETWPGEIFIDPWKRVHCVLDGYPAVMVAVRDGGQPIDIACFASSSPELAYTLRGVGAIVGYQNYDHALSTGSRLLLHATVPAWIDAGGAGAAVVDWFTARGLLVQLKEISCTDREHAADVQNRLKPCGPPQPKLFVRRKP